MHGNTSTTDETNNNNKENVAALVPSPQRRQHADYTDDNSVRQVLQEFMNEKMTLILHTKGPTSKSYSPQAIHSWFERGQVRFMVDACKY